MLASHRYATIPAILLVAAGLIAARGEPPETARAEPGVIRDGYESDRPSWQQEYTDTTVRLLAHERSDRAAHGGRASERFRFEAGQGSRFFVSQALPKIPVTEDLAVSLYVRSNRQGAQIFGWVVLPEDIDPETKAPSFLLVPGGVFSRPDRWEKLSLAEMRPAIEEQARVLRASTRRPVSVKGAYVERVVVNLMAGMGETDVFLDDLQIGPVPPELAAAWSTGRAPADREGTDARPKTRRAGAVKDQGELPLPRVRLTRGVFERLVDGQRYVPWFPTAIDAPGADPVALRRHGFDVLVTGPEPDLKRVPPLLEGDKPMFLLPRLSPATEEGGPQRVLREISEYPLLNSVMMWSIGEHLGRERESAARMQEVQRIRQVLAALDEEDVPHLATATVDNELRLYTRPPSNLDVIGVELPIWGTMEGFMEGLAYLKQRRDITARTNLEALFWAWLPVTTAGGRHAQYLGDRRGAALGHAAGPARAGPAHDLHGPGGRLSGDHVRRRCRPHPAGRASRCCSRWVSSTPRSTSSRGSSPATSRRSRATRSSTRTRPIARPSRMSTRSGCPCSRSSAASPGCTPRRSRSSARRGPCSWWPTSRGAPSSSRRRWPITTWWSVRGCRRACSSWKSARARPGSSSRRPTIASPGGPASRSPSSASPR